MFVSPEEMLCKLHFFRPKECIAIGDRVNEAWSLDLYGRKDAASIDLGLLVLVQSKQEGSSRRSAGLLKRP